MYEIMPCFGHYVVYKDGKFVCSADTYAEAVREIAEARKAIKA